MPSLSYSNRWCDNKLKNKLEVEISNMCDETTIISRVPEGNVYHVAGYVVKERMGIKGPKPVVYREFLIGKRLNKLNAPHMVKTCGYMETNHSSRLVLELIKGTTLSKFLKDPNTSKHEAARMLLHVILILGSLQQDYGFCHYGLHSANIMIQTLNHRKKFSYKVYGREYTVHSNYYPIIIDLGRSYVRGVPRMFYEGERVEVLTTPGIFDGQVDYAYILWSTRRYLSLPKTCRMLRKNELFRSDVEDNIPKLNRGVVKGIPSRLLKEDSLWAGREQSDSDPIDVIKQFRRGSISDALCIKKLDEYCVYHKKRQIKNRKYSNKAVFRMLVKELTAIKNHTT